MTAGVPHPVDVIVGNNLRIMRQQRRISQTVLGNELSITFQQVQKYEKGTNRISASKLADISKFFGVSVASFFEGSGIDGSDTPLMPYSKEALQIAQTFDNISDPKVRTRLKQLIVALGSEV